MLAALELMVAMPEATRLESRRVLITGENAELATRLGAAFERAGATVGRAGMPARGADGSLLAAAAVRELGRLDVLVNIGPASLPGDASPRLARPVAVEKALRRYITLLVTTTEAALPAMEAGASIINVTVPSSPAPTPAQDALAAAVVDTSQGWAELLSARGIRVNAVIGGPVFDRTVEADLDKALMCAEGSQDAELDVFVYLASEHSSHVSGSVVSVARSSPSSDASAEGVG